LQKNRKEKALSAIKTSYLNSYKIPKPVITNRHNISPIEYKSGKSFTTTSLNKLRAKFAPKLQAKSMAAATT